jgi:2'-5' RNA ligase
MTYPTRRLIQSIIALIPQVDATVGRFRAADDWSAHYRVPPHITLAGPWPLSVDLQAAGLAPLVATACGTACRLDEIGMLGDALCLFPADDEALRALRRRLLEAIGRRDGVTTEWRPHLTVARHLPAEHACALQRELAPLLPIICELREVCLARLLDNDSVELTTLAKS